MMRALVTGAGGFVGKRLVPLLEARGDEVFAHDLDVDISDAAAIDAAVANARPEAVIHLAAVTSIAGSWKDPDRTFRVNFLGTRNLLRALERRAPKARLLLISSGSIYGSALPGASPRNESAPLRPSSPYDDTKAAAEYLAAAAAEKGLDVVRVRAFNHTGAGQSDVFVASSFAKQLAEMEAGSREPRMAVGNLASVRDFLDVADVLRAYLALLDPAVPADVYNVARGEGTKIQQILDGLIALSSADPQVEIDPERVRPTDSLVGDASKLRSRTGWQPEIPLEATLGALLDSWRETLS
ncbi:MAG: GDP-mannose 4,6-dehydratase [Myxococcota bacterium]|jgi:GDP-4-dehydro-6-deoxy-D-mannose reductase